MIFIRYSLCTGNIRRWIYCTSVYPQVKKIKKYLIQKSINQSSYMNAEIEWGRGGKSVFFSNKDLGTRVVD